MPVTMRSLVRLFSIIDIASAIDLVGQRHHVDPNGTRTLYAHMYKVAIKTGDQIAQGQVIGSVGSTGHSTGPHLHFEVFGAKNPGADWSWANTN